MNKNKKKAKVVIADDSMNAVRLFSIIAAIVVLTVLYLSTN